MISNNIEELNLPGAVVSDGSSARTRLLPRADGGGLSIGDTVIEAGHVLELWDPADIESCHCVEGTAEIENGESATIEALRPGMVLSIRNGGPMRIRALQRLRLIFTFAGDRPRATGDWHDS